MIAPILYFLFQICVPRELRRLKQLSLARVRALVVVVVQVLVKPFSCSTVKVQQ